MSLLSFLTTGEMPRNLNIGMDMWDGAILSGFVNGSTTPDSNGMGCAPTNGTARSYGRSGTLVINGAQGLSHNNQVPYTPIYIYKRLL